MSDIETIKKRNDRLYATVHNYLAAHGWLPAKSMSDDPRAVDDAARQAERDIDTLLSEIASRDAEIERLRGKVAMWDEIGAWLENAYPYAIAEAILATSETTTRRRL